MIETGRRLVLVRSGFHSKPMHGERSKPLGRRGLKIVLAPACACWLLAGCAAKPVDGRGAALTASSRLDVAEAAEESGDKQTAAGMYLAAANEAPKDASVQLRAAEGLARNGRLDDAQALLERRLKGGPTDLDLLRTLGAVQVMAGKPAAAVRSLSAVLVRAPDDVRAMVDKAVALDISRRHAEAQVLYRQALILAPGDAAVSNDLALSLMLSGQSAEAEGVLAPFRESSGLPERIRTNLGIVDAASGHSADAQAVLGSRIGAADLATLTAAIGRGGVLGCGEGGRGGGATA
jgi:Flp pilus assembly protein TadD